MIPGVFLMLSAPIIKITQLHFNLKFPVHLLPEKTSAKSKARSSKKQVKSKLFRQIWTQGLVMIISVHQGVFFKVAQLPQGTKEIIRLEIQGTVSFKKQIFYSNHRIFEKSIPNPILILV